jgi:hypothetical protein
MFGRHAAAGDSERHPAGVSIEVLGAQRKSPDDVLQQGAEVLPGADAGNGRREPPLPDRNQPERSRSLADGGDGGRSGLPGWPSRSTTR